MKLKEAMEKRVLLSLPVSLYKKVSEIATEEYRTIPSVIRECVADQLGGEELTAEEVVAIKRGEEEYKEGKCIKWRKIARGKI